MEKLYTMPEVAEMFGVSTRTVQRWMAGRGVDVSLACHRINRKTTRITESNLAQFMLDNKVEMQVPLALGHKLREAKVQRELQAISTHATLSRFYPDLFPASKPAS